MNLYMAFPEDEQIRYDEKQIEESEVWDFLEQRFIECVDTASTTFKFHSPYVPVSYYTDTIKKEMLEQFDRNAYSVIFERLTDKNESMRGTRTERMFNHFKQTSSVYKNYWDLVQL